MEDWFEYYLENKMIGFVNARHLKEIQLSEKCDSCEGCVILALSFDKEVFTLSEIIEDRNVAWERMKWLVV